MLKMTKQFQISLSILIYTLIVSSLLSMVACTLLPTPTPTSIPSSTPTIYILITAMVARTEGKLVNEDGCIRVISSETDPGETLVWPPDLKMSIGDGGIRVVSGIVAGDRREYDIKFGEWVIASGGIYRNLDEQLKETIPDHCPEPYFVVGGIMDPTPITPEPK